MLHGTATMKMGSRPHVERAGLVRCVLGDCGWFLPRLAIHTCCVPQTRSRSRAPSQRGKARQVHGAIGPSLALSEPRRYPLRWLHAMVKRKKQQTATKTHNVLTPKVSSHYPNYIHTIHTLQIQPFRSLVQKAKHKGISSAQLSLYMTLQHPSFLNSLARPFFANCSISSLPLLFCCWFWFWFWCCPPCCCCWPPP